MPHPFDGLPPLWIIAVAVLGMALAPPLVLLAGRVTRPPRRFGRRVILLAAAVLAGLFALIAASFAAPLELVAYLVFVASAVVLSIVDLAEHRLPDVVVLPTLALVAVTLISSGLARGSWPAIVGVIAGGAALFAVYLLLAIISPRGMGMGDVKLAAVVGAAAGYLGLTAWLVALLAGFFIGAVISLIGLARGRFRMKSLVPFGPSMLAGAVLAVILN